MVKRLDYEINCPECKSKIEAEATYDQIKGIYKHEEELALVCPNCSHEFDVTDSYFDKIIGKLPGRKKTKIKNFISDGSYSRQRKEEVDGKNARVSLIITISTIFFIILVILSGVLYLPNYLGKNVNISNTSFKNVIGIEENESFFEWQNNPYIEECVDLANEDELIPVSKYQISTCEMVDGELKVTYTTLG